MLKTNQNVSIATITTKYIHNHKTRSAFTMIELTIVMIVMAVLVGGGYTSPTQSQTVLNAA